MSIVTLPRPLINVPVPLPSAELKGTHTPPPAIVFTGWVPAQGRQLETARRRINSPGMARLCKCAGARNEAGGQGGAQEQPRMGGAASARVKERGGPQRAVSSAGQGLEQRRAAGKLKSP